MSVINVYTDGSWDSKDKYGGWAFYLYIGDKCLEGSGYSPKTTNNQMELVAIYEALLAIKDLPMSYQQKKIIVRTDSMYCISRLTTDKNKNGANSQLIARCKRLVDSYNIKINHIKGHSGNTYNEYVDRLAVMARFKGKKKLRSLVKSSYEEVRY